MVSILPKRTSFGPLVFQAVQSPKAPYNEQAFPTRDSIKCPIVILDGKACGLTIISGLTPLAEKGISDSGKIIPIVPFCPARLQNLSPIDGSLSCLTLTFANLNPSSPSVINALSTYPNCPFFGTTEESEYTLGSLTSVVHLPINTILSFNFVFSLIIPSLFR